MKSMYLAHPFDARHWVRKWELAFEKETGLTLNNPFYDQPNRADVEKIDAGRAERYAELIASDLVRKDLRFILASDGVLAIIDGSTSYGTLMEIVYAHLYGLPVYLIISNGHHDHPWLKYHSDKIFRSCEAAKRHFKPCTDATLCPYISSYTDDGAAT